MHVYTQWDYSNSFSMADNTKMGIYYILKEGDPKKINNFLSWLKEEQSSFMFNRRDFIFTRLVEFKHFSIADDFCSIKHYQFDERIAKTCASNLSITFNVESFNYWKNHLEKLNESQQSIVIRSFWGEFLSSQFIQPQDYEKGLENLLYVFEKIPFYIDLGRVSSNYYLIKERAEFFDKSSLNTNQQNQLLKQIGIMCANKYSHAKDLFMEEFAKHHVALEAFNTVLLHNTLHESLKSKKSVSKIKI